MGVLIEEYHRQYQENKSSVEKPSTGLILGNTFPSMEKGYDQRSKNLLKYPRLTKHSKSEGSGEEREVNRENKKLVFQHNLETVKLRIVGQEMHMNHVEGYSVAIGKTLYISGDELKDLALAAKLHDVGKAFLEPGILNMPRKLTEEEMEEVKKHPEIGYWLLKADSRYQKVAEYVRHHHERWDGLGYPGGLKGGEIPLFSRIIAVADAYDAMTSKRVYQRTKSCPEAVRELIKHSGSQFDPSIVKIFVEKVLWMVPWL